MKVVLLPTDFSDISLHAIQYARNLLKDKDTLFYLLNVFKIPFATNEELMEHDVQRLAELEDELYADSQRALMELARSFDPNPRHRFLTISDYNSFLISLKEVIEKKKIDLLIMGTKGATGAKEILLGSNTGDAILKTTVDLLAVPKESEIKSPKEIVFPTDFKYPFEESDLNSFLVLAKASNCKVHIVHFNEGRELTTDQQARKDQLTHLLEGLDHEYYFLTQNDLEQGLNCFLESRKTIDMIVLMLRKYSFFQRLFLRHRVKELSYHTRLPLMVLRQS